ncbi:MAG: hypothetical protein LBS54_04105 [Dysgonamonadaceae bacterium]|jgi:hypothetical protein|nr:hypothetical protein [Dysgonamonadaceae bacterium]
MSTIVTPIAVKYELHAYGQVLDVSNCLEDWQELEIKLTREDFSGVFQEISFPLKFKLEGYDAVKNIFEQHKYKSQAQLYVYLRQEDWTYSAPYIFELDFSTYSRTDATIEMNIVNSSLVSKIKSNGKIKFEIPVNEINNPYPLKYDRITLKQKLRTLADLDNEKREQSPSADPLFKIRYPIPSSFGQNEITVDVGFEQKTIPFSNNDSGDLYFLEYNGTHPIQIEFSFKCSGKMASSKTPFYYFRLGIFLNNGKAITDFSSPSGYYNVDLDLNFTETITLNPGDKLKFMVEYNISIKTEITTTLSAEIELKYIAADKEQMIDIINPKRVLQTLIDKITDTTGTYSTDILDFNTNYSDLDMIIAAESIRKLDDAKLYINYNDFAAWLSMLGYEPEINGNAISFVSRRSLYDSVNVFELEEADVAGMNETLNSDLLFSGVKVGYDKQSYENVNGRFEFNNGMTEYKTDAFGSVIELKSPFRADAYGIEFMLSESLGKDTSDNKADKAVFFVNVKAIVQHHEDPGLPDEIFYAETIKNNFNPPYNGLNLFNGKYNPFNLLKRNLDIIGASANSVEFTSSETNSDIIIDGEAINQNYIIPTELKILDAVTYEFASKNIRSLPGQRNGLVRFKYKGELKEGYIREIMKNYAWETETQWTLMKKYVPVN